MNPLRRWMKFNVVGIAGMLVQLVTLAGLNHIVPRHYLVNSLVAVETAILHNFIAHVHYTWRDRLLHHPWRDRRRSMVLLRPLWRFQLSNGAVSLVGNAVLIKLLVGGAHLPVLAANLVAIVICGLANFRLGDAWAFASRKRKPRSQKRDVGHPQKGLCWRGVALALIVMQVGIAVGQETTAAASQPSSAPQQPVVVLSPAAQKVKDAIGRIGEDGRITVHMLNGVVYHGRVGSTESDRFTVHEVDLAQTVPIRYDEVRSVKANYGGKNLYGRHLDPLQHMVIGLIIVGGLIGTVLIAVASDKS